MAFTDPQILFWSGFTLTTIVLYIYKSICLMKIGKKFLHPYSWLAWIPIADVCLILSMGRFSWAWIFLALIPIIGWLAVCILVLIALHRIGNARNFAGWTIWLSLIPVLGRIWALVYIGILALKK